MPPHHTHPSDPRPADTGMRAQIADLVTEAETQLRNGLWELTSGDAALARTAAAGLAEVVRPAAEQDALPVIKRLEHLREALAVLAVTLARTHGPLAWFLARASAALSPVLTWRAVPAAGRRQTFGAALPTPDELHDAEDAVRHLHTTLARTGDQAPGQRPPHGHDPSAPPSGAGG
ncbi:hypothetical protein HYE82_29085 [Streptomyces sp. BR123]|uniref:hypothetical protein n=1 Tax=Streptomyces sp. BR123 TaxID=2749828 RepID=UPI0015C44BB7|nr:hypothetical protein [Streptomyces sp. BR123]NXY98356.1 hypothetical protein [Streptomyces sp. BR123]